MSGLDALGRCKGHLWDWVRDDYTVAVYRCASCGRERRIWKNRVAAFEAKERASGNGQKLVRGRRPA